ncbi:hypothetical protein EDB19DRAFT_1699338 [Suillus lakei]|nr:hypothetical protein EDB19DRAFT_1699338 [Suillus lakei]
MYLGHARRDMHRASRTRAHMKDLDQIQLIDLDPKVLISSAPALEAQPIDLEKPGLAQHYCVECAKHFKTDMALQLHWKGEVHKRRCKALKEPAYRIEEAERAAGLGRERKRTPIAAQAMPTDT